MKIKQTPEYKLCKQVVDHYKELSKQCDALGSLLGIVDYETPLMRSIWHAFDAYTASAQREMHDYRDRLTWYIYDNHCGKKKLITTIVTPRGPLTLRPIITVAHLAMLIRYNKLLVRQ